MTASPGWGASQPSAERWALAALVSAALLVRLALAVVTPAFQAPDEEGHLYYVEFLGENARLPEQPARTIEVWLDPASHAYHPPLAYLSFVPLERGLSAAGASPEWKLRALRAQNALYGAATVWIGYLVVALLTPLRDPRRWMVAALLAFVPGFVGVTSSLNNDGLANLLALLLWVPLLGGVRRRLRPWLLGALFGAACLSKLTVLVLAPVLLIVPLLRRDVDRVKAVEQLLIAGAVAAVMAAPWMLRNQLVYGNPLAIGVGSFSFTWLQTLLPADVVARVAEPMPGKALLQFWGRFGIYNNLSWSPIPWVLLPLAAIALPGWLLAWRERARDALERSAPAFFAALVLSSAGLAYFSLTYYGGWQGRYVYPALLPVCALLAGGWSRVLPERSRIGFVGGLAGVLLALDGVLVWKLHAFFATQAPVSWGLARAL